MEVGKAKKLEARLPSLFSRSFSPLEHIRRKARKHVLVRGELNERSRAKEENIQEKRAKGQWKALSRVQFPFSELSNHSAYSET
jgi:hypothetical protein